jgi:D-galactose 1-dehydrogenase
MTSVPPLRLAVVGIGKIARDQHLPTIAAHAGVELVAAVDLATRLEGTPSFKTLREAFAQVPGIQAVVVSTPPVARHAQASLALAAGRHVFLEKPPGATLAEVDKLCAHARAASLTLFASWHSRYAAGVEQARQWLAGKRVRRVHIDWKEDVRKWHPGQDWIFAAGGMGVFDPAINALSIVTHLLPPLSLEQAQLDVPANRQAPVRATLKFAGPEGTTVSAELDFLHRGEERWNIDVDTDDGHLQLLRGGASLKIDGRDQALPAVSEYERLYDRFIALVRARESDVDLAPFVHVADAFMLGERRLVEPFSW